MKKRAIGSMLGVLVLCLIIAGCSSPAVSAKANLYNNSAKIAGEGDSFTFVDKQGGNDEGSGDLTYKGFGGFITLWSIDNPADAEGTLTISCKLKTSEGESKLVYIHPDGTLQVLAEGDADTELQVAAAKGVGRIKLVGKKAKGSISVKLTASDGVKVTAVKDFE